MCTDLEVTNERVCTFTVQTVVCNNVVGLKSREINVTLKGKL